MRWLLVFLACCFCACSYAGRYSCGNRCKGYMTNNADYHHDESGKNNSCHIPGDIQPVHHEQAEDVRGNGQDERYIPSFPLCQIAGAKSVDLTEKEDGQGRHKDCKAVHHSQYD